MTFFTTLTLATALASPQAVDCTLSPGTRTEQRAFTNADLDRMAACRYQTGVLSNTAAETTPPEKAERAGRKPTGSPSTGRPDREYTEADWRAQWRSVDQKARKLRRDAYELRQEALESPRDPKKRVVGRRAPSLLIARAETLEAEARELEDQFNERARREGALPGWIRAKTR